MLAALWPGSILTVTEFDRFARDVADAHTILTRANTHNLDRVSTFAGIHRAGSC